MFPSRKSLFKVTKPASPFLKKNHLNYIHNKKISLKKNFLCVCEHF